ncbi:hypothetical protein BH23ACT2_BH23ACT2_18520 [soil metagenome]
MERLRPYPVTVFCAVTLFTWGNRIWLAWTNDSDTLVEKLVWSIPITFFVVAAAVLAVALLAGVDRRAPTFTTLVRAFAGGTVAYWAARYPIIAVGDWSVGFKVVHAVLAVASATAAVAAWRSVGRDRTDTGGRTPAHTSVDAFRRS